MRPTVEYTRDPLRPPDPEAIAGMQLEYRTRPMSPRSERRHAMAVLVRHAVLCFVLVIGLRMGALLGHPLVYGAMCLFGLLLALSHIVSARPWSEVIRCAAGGVVLSLGIILIQWVFGTPAGSMLFLAVALGIACYHADAIATHQAFWMSAHPMVRLPERRSWRERWSDRFEDGYERFRRAVDGLRRPPHQVRELDLYPIGFLIVLAAFLVGTLVFLIGGAGGFAGLAGVCIFLVALMVLAVAWNQYDHADPRQAFLLSWEALVNWLVYNAHDTQAAGVFQSPCGHQRRRSFVTGVALFALYATLLPAATYFPIGRIGSDDPASHVELPEWPWNAKTPQTPTPPAPVVRHEPPAGRSTREIWNTLPESQKLYAGQLPPAERERYIQALGGPPPVAPAPTPTVAPAPEPEASTSTTTSTRPEDWLVAALLNDLRHGTAPVWSVLFAVLLSVVVPPLTLLAVNFAVCGRVLRLYEQNLEIKGAPTHERDKHIWDVFTDRLRNSTHLLESEHFWLGTNPENDYPVLLHRPLLKAHAHITGSTGSNKTSVGLLYPLVQLLRRADASIVVLDCKGDPALFHAARIEAERAGLPFKWFTLNRHDSTYAFNPFLQSYDRYLTVNQRAQILLAAMGLEYGEFYGGGYFSAVNELGLKRCLASYANDIHSFRDLLRCIDSKDLYGATGSRTQRRLRKSEWEDTTHLSAAVDRLAGVVPMNVTAENTPHPRVIAEAIDMPDVLARRQVVYFYLPTNLEPISAHGAAKLALYALLTSAFLHHEHMGRPEENQPPDGVYVFIDEFQEIVAHNLQRVLNQVRGFGISAILANQNIADLKKPDCDLIPVVEENTSFKQIFTTHSLAQLKAMVEASGEGMYHMYGMAYDTEMQAWSSGIKVTESIGPRYRPNDLIQMSAEKDRSIVRFGSNSGLTRYSGFLFELKSGYHISEEDHKKREKMPWPAATESTLPPGFDFPPEAPPGEQPVTTASPSPIPPAAAEEEDEATRALKNALQGYEDDNRQAMDELRQSAKSKRRKKKPHPEDNNDV